MQTKFYLLFLFLISFTFNALAQGITISGKVKDKATGKAIEEAEVFLINTAYKTLTDEKGKYKLQDVKPGTYKIAAFYLGMKSVSEAFTADKDFIFDFTLEEITHTLDEVTFTGEREMSMGLLRLNAVENDAIYEGKKNEVIVLSDMTINTATNNSRQVYAKVAGLNIWESDGAGIQLGIGARGLSPNRTANFNTRQNGYEISADALGYPESYYTPPVEAVDRIVVVRGASSLQYGTQFGGLLNFVMKRGPEGKPVEVTARQTVGSFGFYNAFTSVGGKKGNLDYYVFHQYKRGNGWRPNSGFEANTAFIDLNYQVTPKLFVCFEYTFMDYLAQQPGGLTDRQFEQDPRQSNRERNWFKVNWNLAALILEYKFTDQTKLNIRNFGLLAGRDALGNLERIHMADHMQERNLIRDNFRNFGTEARLIHHYHALGLPAALVTGVRAYRGYTHKQQGLANAGKAADFYFLNPGNLENSDFSFPSQNYAAFVENVFNITPRFSVTPGIRFENIQTFSNGYYKETTMVPHPTIPGRGIDSTFQKIDDRKNSRSLMLLGLGLSYKPYPIMEVYANASQNYRAMNFNDIRVNNPNIRVDENIEDERGYNLDLGLRGSYAKKINYDFSLFYLFYNNRIGRYLTHEERPGGIIVPVNMRTNLGNSRAAGFESLIEADILKILEVNSSNSKLNAFSNFALIDARYVNMKEKAFENNRVELVPPYTLRTGLSYGFKAFKASCQYSHVGGHYTDATNTEFDQFAIMGYIPSYNVMDLAFSYKYKYFTFETGCNNLTNNMYFTRRAEGYPGPGIIPSDGRSYYFTLQVKI